MEYVRFYSVRKAWGELSNFETTPFEVDGVSYGSVEHWFQASKTLDSARQSAIRLASSPSKAAKMGRAKKATLLREDWEDVKDKVMYVGCLAKFAQNTGLWAVLDSTQSATLIERTKNDVYWGDGGDGRGQNRLGEILMEVRAELRAAEALLLMGRHA